MSAPRNSIHPHPNLPLEGEGTRFLPSGEFLRLTECHEGLAPFA